MAEEGRTLDVLEKVENFFLHSPIPPRFKVLFLFLPSYEHLKTLWRVLQNKRELYAVYHLEDFLKEGKNWLSISDLQRIITQDLPKRVKEDGNTERLIFLFSLGEFLKFLTRKELEDFLVRSFTIWEDLPLKGVVIPVVGGKEKLLSVLKREHRHLAGETKNYLVWEDREPPQKLRLFVLLRENLKLPEGVEVVDTLKGFLKTLNPSREEGKFVYLKKLTYRIEEIAEGERTLEVITFSTHRDIVRKFFRFEEPFYLEPSEEVLKELIPLLEKGKKTYGELLENLFGDLRVEELLYELLGEGTNTLKGWLIANYLLKEFPDWREIFEDFEPSEVVLKLYKSPEVEKNLKRRLFKLLEERGSPLIPTLCEKLKDENPKGFLGILSCESEILLKLHSEGKIDEATLKEKLKEVKHYLREVATDLPPKVEEYLKEYKRCKLKDQFSERLKTLLEELNRSEESFYGWYYKIPKLEELLAKYPNAEVYLLDAVGGEWLGFIVEFLRERGISVKEYRYAVVEIPTTTEVNLNVFERSGLKWKKLDDFDRLIHNHYEFPKTLIEEFETIKKLLKKVGSPSGIVIITADHGSTALSRLAEALNLKNCQPQHGGRYCEGRYETEYSLIYEGDGKAYTVAKFHNSLGKKPSSEVHGGVLPEEVIVPFVVLSDRPAEGGITFKLQKEEIYAGEPLKVEIGEGAKSLRVEIDDRPVKFKLLGKYLVVERKETKKLREGTHKLRITLEGKTFEITFKVKKRFEEKDLGLNI